LQVRIRKLGSNFVNFQKYNFARQVQNPVPIYPGDKVVVLPPWGNQKISDYARKRLQRFQKEEIKKRVGTVLRVLRTKNMITVSGINIKPVYKSPSYFMKLYERKSLNSIKPCYREMPININRVKLRDPSKKKFAEPIEVKIVKNESGERIRLDIVTKKVIPFPKSRKDLSYDSRNLKKKTGFRDTPSDLLHQITYTGEDFTKVASFFIKKIKNKESIEQKLILKDK
jgi:ribosomal protein L24